MKTGHDNQRFIVCECGGEGILITHLDWNDNDDYKNEFEIAMLKKRNYKNNLWQRIKYATWHLWTGKIYKDQIVFNYSKAGQIISFLKNKMETKTKTSKPSNN